MISASIEDSDISLSEVMTRWPETIPVFLRYHMRCVGCLVASFHTVSDACCHHDACEEAFRKDLALAVDVRSGRC